MTPSVYIPFILSAMLPAWVTAIIDHLRRGLQASSSSFATSMPLVLSHLNLSPKKLSVASAAVLVAIATCFVMSTSLRL